MAPKGETTWIGEHVEASPPLMLQERKRLSSPCCLSLTVVMCNGWSCGCHAVTVKLPIRRLHSRMAEREKAGYVTEHQGHPRTTHHVTESCCTGTATARSLSCRGLPVWSHCRHREQKRAGSVPSYTAVPSYSLGHACSPVPGASRPACSRGPRTCRSSGGNHGPWRRGGQ